MALLRLMLIVVVYLLLGGGGPSGSRGETITGGAAFGPVEMTVPGAGKHGTGGGGVEG